MNIIYSAKFFLKLLLFFNIFLKNWYNIVPGIIIYRLYCYLNIYLSITYTNYFRGNKNIQMYVSPIKQYKYSFTLMLFDVFVVSPKQTAFIIHYMYLVGFYKYFNISTFLKNLLKIISIVIIVSVLDIPYLLYRLGYIIINNIWVYGIINLEYNTYRVIRERFTYGVGFNELSIRAFDGFIKLNMFSVTKSNAEKLSSVLSKPVKNQVNERLISLGSRDYIHRDIPLIPGNKEGIALCLSHNSPVEPILDSSEVLGLKQTGFLLNPQNLNFIRTVDTKLINCKYGALRIITLYKLINNEGFLIENNIAAGFHNRVTWTEPDHNLKIRELMLSENYKTIAELKLNNTLNAETIRMALNSSSNPLERKVWDYVYNHTSKDTILEMRNLPQLNYIQKIKLFQQLYPNLFHYNSISNILWQETFFEGFYTVFRLKDITIIVDHEGSLSNSKKHHKVIMWDRVSYLLLYIILSSIEEFGMYSNNSTVVPDSYVIDTKVVHIETYDAPGDFSQVDTKKYPTEVSISTMFIDIISTKSKKITLVYKNHKDLEKSTYYIPIFEPRDSTYEDELMEHLDENAYKG